MNLMLNKNKQIFQEFCSNCQKGKPLCVCDSIIRISNKTQILILQHPQEPDKMLGTARIAELCLEKGKLVVALSKPNLSKILGRQVENSRWGVLYLGGKADFSKFRDERLLQLKKGGVIESARSLDLEGVVVLDGTWSQAKALWWRNPWLLKLKRLAINPKKKSLYGDLRKEPRRECLSTIESIAELLEARGEDPKNSEALRQVFLKLLEKYRALNTGEKKVSEEKDL